MPVIDLSDEEHTALTALVRRAIADDKCPLSPRLAPLKSALAKLDPASVAQASPTPSDAFRCGSRSSCRPVAWANATPQLRQHAGLRRCFCRPVVHPLDPPGFYDLRQGEPAQRVPAPVHRTPNVR